MNPAVRRAAESMRAAGQPVTADNGTVTAPGTDPVACVVTVTVGLDTFTAPYLAMSVLPVVGDIVRVEFTAGSPLVIGVIPGATAAP